MHLPLHFQPLPFVVSLLLCQSSFTAAQASDAPNSPLPSSPSPIFTESIQIDDTIIGDIEIYVGEEPADAVFRFIQSHGLDHSYKSSILARACTSLPCSRTRALLFDSPVISESGAFIGNIEIYEGEEPADVAFEFSNLHNLTDGYFEAILADACDNVECTRVEPIIFRLPVDLGEGEELELTMIEGEDPIEVVYDFCVEHGLDQEAMEALLSEADDSPWVEVDWDALARFISGDDAQEEGQEDTGLIYSVPVQDEVGEIIGTVGFYEHQEPADVVYDFCQMHGLDDQYRNAILANACDHLECHRAEAAIYSQNIDMGERGIEVFTVLEGEDPQDSISEFCSRNGLGEDCRRTLTNEVSQHVEFERERFLVWDQEVQIDSETSLGRLHIYEGQEPADAIYDFLFDKELPEEEYVHTRDFLINHACSGLPCARREAVLWSETIETEDGHVIGEVQVREGEEPIDAIHNFIVHHNLDRDYRQSILVACCEEIACTRDKRVVYRHNVNAQTGSLVLEILEGEEVVDAVVKFVIDYKVDVDMVSFKNYFFQDACDRGLEILCTRNYAILLDIPVQDEDGKTNLGRLVVQEGQDPLNVLWVLLSESIEDLEKRMRFYNEVKPKVCRMDYITCTGNGPIIFQQSISGPGGETVGVLRVHVGEEPVDATYKFFARYGLFEKDWDFKGVFKQVCALEALQDKCKRQEALKYLEENKVIDGINIGHIVVWEHQEVIDVLYQKRIEHGLTITQQMTLFHEICQKEEVYCKRTRAAVLTSQVNKLDFDQKYDVGNATCNRVYMGWRYQVWDNTGITFNETLAGPLKSKLRGMTGMISVEEGLVKVRPLKPITTMLNEEEGFVESMIGDPLFAVYYVGGFYVLARLMCWFVGIRMGWGGGIFRWRRLGMVSNVLLLFSSMISSSFFYIWGVEPSPQIDTAMHDFKGALPDLEILEGQHVADAVWKWAKVSEKKHHPLLRKPVHWGMIDEICNYSPREDLKDKCIRKRAYIEIDMGSITSYGHKHDILYWKNPNATVEEEIESGRVSEAAKEMCDRIVPPMANCYADIEAHMTEQYKQYEAMKYDKKNMYTKLGISSDAPTEEVWRAAGRALRELGDNFVPFARIDNGTKVNHKWSTNTHHAHAIQDKIAELLDEEDREWYDKPCEPVFGGAMCAKKDASGNMMIEMGAGEE